MFEIDIVKYNKDLIEMLENKIIKTHKQIGHITYCDTKKEDSSRNRTKFTLRKC